MNFKIKNKAFTLTELLIALGIIGTIAAISIPSLVSNINNKILATQLKNIVVSIQELSTSQMLSHRTKSLTDTDFSSPTELLSSKNFEIIKSCSSTSAGADCWKTNATDNRVDYRIMGSKLPYGFIGSTYTSIILKNGAVLGFKNMNETIAEVPVEEDEIIGTFAVDVNGRDNPNIIGRDAFEFFITRKGKILDSSTPNLSITDKISKCKTESSNFCLGAIMDNGWVMPY